MSKLIKKFRTELILRDTKIKNDLDTLEKLEQINDDFTIKFSEWKDKNCFNQGDGFYNRNYKDEAFTLTELIKLYKDNHYE